MQRLLSFACRQRLRLFFLGEGEGTKASSVFGRGTFQSCVFLTRETTIRKSPAALSTQKKPPRRAVRETRCPAREANGAQLLTGNSRHFLSIQRKAREKREREREERRIFLRSTLLQVSNNLFRRRRRRREKREERRSLYQQVNARNVDKRGGSNGSLARDRGE